MNGFCSNNDRASDSPDAIFFPGPICAPVFPSVDFVRVAQFSKEGERYEIEIYSKLSAILLIKVLPHTARMKHALLKNL